MTEMMSKTIRFPTSGSNKRLTQTKIIVARVRRKGRPYKSLQLKEIWALHLTMKKRYLFKDKQMQVDLIRCELQRLLRSSPLHIPKIQILTCRQTRLSAHCWISPSKIKWKCSVLHFTPGNVCSSRPGKLKRNTQRRVGRSAP